MRFTKQRTRRGRTLRKILKSLRAFRQRFRQQVTRVPQSKLRMAKGNAKGHVKRKANPKKRSTQKDVSKKTIGNIEQYTCNIQSELRNMSQPNIDSSVPTLQWPTLLRPVFAISLRPQRWLSLVDRMKRWRSFLELVPATDGRKINGDQWKQAGRLQTDLTNGQIGCYESHARAWQRVIDRNLPYGLILEDDADIQYTQDFVDKLNEALLELKQVPNWDIVYLGNSGRFTTKRQRTKNLVEISNYEVLHTYLVTNRCAHTLVAHAFPIREAVDLHIGTLASKGFILPLARAPALDLTVGAESDTNRHI